MNENVCSGLSALITVLPKGQSGRFVGEARGRGLGGATVFAGRGTAPTTLLSLLSLADSKKEIILSVAPDAVASAIAHEFVEISNQGASKKDKIQGIVASFHVGGFLNPSKGEVVLSKGDSMQKSSEREGKDLIFAIIPDGVSEEIMNVARKVGAPGGTVISGKGTSRPDDAEFFGMKIVPEKEILMIVCPTEETDKIMNAIKADPSLSNPGTGIVFSVALNNFWMLGGGGAN